MSSYRHGKPTGLTKLRLEGGTVICGRELVAAYTRCHPKTVRKWCRPIACDAGTRADLYDLEDAERTLKARRS